MTQTLDKLEKLAAILNEESPSREEVMSFARGLTEYVRAAANTLATQNKEQQKQALDGLDKAITLATRLESRLDSKVQKSAAQIVADVKKMVQDVERKIPNLPDLTDIYARLSSLEFDTEDIAADTVRDRLESLEGEERLDVSAIKGIEELIKEKAPSTKGGSMTAYARGEIKLYDLSSQLDGVTKTFQLPAFKRILLVQSSSFPNAFRPITDFTSDASGMTITFTSEVTAGTTLAPGQTITILYAEP